MAFVYLLVLFCLFTRFVGTRTSCERSIARAELFFFLFATTLSID